MARTNFENLGVYEPSEQLSDRVWNETKHWLRRAYKRRRLTIKQVDRLKPVLDELAPKLNADLNSIGKVRVTE
jgi:hypothetical protein